MIKTKIECDGCGEIVEIEPGGHSEEIRIGCLVSINGEADKKFDLCRNCQQTLSERADPSKWARLAAA